MPSETFDTPQRQSAVGILLIFLQVAYKFLRAAWGVFAFFFISYSSSKAFVYSLVALIVLVVIGLIYSYFHYRRFKFYIDYEKEEFALEKGVFSSESIKIPFDKIQQVDLKRSLLQRLIGVYSLTIDTAGSKDDEIDIKAVTQAKAQNLSAILTRAKNEKQQESTEKDPGDIAQTPSDRLWMHRLSLWDLLKIGLTRSYLRGFILMVAFVSSLWSQIQPTIELKNYISTAEDYSVHYLSSSSQRILMLLGLCFILLVLSVLITVGEVVFKHFNLKIQQTPTRLEVEMGLRTNTRVSFQSRRLQRLEISTNPIQKRFDLYEAKFALASSRDSLNKSKLSVPGLHMELVQKIKSFLYETSYSDEGKSFKPHFVWLYRRLYLCLLPLMGILGLGYLMDQWSHQLIWIVFCVLYLAVLFPYQWFVYQSIRMEISNDFLVVHQGLWTQRQYIIELYKMEAVSVKQPFFYRRRNLYNLTFHTAGGDVQIRAIPKNFIREINFILYRIETAQKAWM